MTHRHRTAAAALLAVFTVVVDNTKVNVALPVLARVLAADETTLQWVVESYVLAFAALLLLGGAVADRFGPATTMRVGILGFAAGSLLAAAAPSVGVLVAARVVTGLAAALVMPATLAAVVAALPGARSRVVAGWTGVVALGVAVGPVVGGALLAVAPWPHLFWLNVPLAIGVAVVLLRTARPAPAAGRIDVRGSGLLAGIVLGVVAAVTEAPRHAWLVLPAGLGALVCAVGYAQHQRRGDPVLPTAVFRSVPLRVSAGALSALFAAIFGMAFLLPQYLQVVRGVGPLATGTFVLAYAIALVAASLAAGAVPVRHRRLLASGGLASAAAVHALTALGLAPTTSAWALAVGLGTIGLGIGLAQTPLTEVVLDAVGPRTGLGSALNDAVREVAGVVGVALLGSVAVTVAGPAPTGPALLDGVRVAAGVAAALLAVGAAATARSTVFTASPDVVGRRARRSPRASSVDPGGPTRCSTCRDRRSCGTLRASWPGRSDEPAESPGPGAAVATALRAVADGRARLHLRRDGRGDRRVPPAVGEDRVGAEHGPARHDRVGHALWVPVRGRDRRHPRRPDRAAQRHALRADLLLRVHARRRGRADLPGVRRRPRPRRVGHRGRERDHRPVPGRVRASRPARLVPRRPRRLLLVRVRRCGADRPVRGPAVRRRLAVGAGRHGRPGAHGAVVAAVAAGSRPATCCCAGGPRRPSRSSPTSNDGRRRPWAPRCPPSRPPRRNRSRSGRTPRRGRSPRSRSCGAGRWPGALRWCGCSGS